MPLMLVHGTYPYDNTKNRWTHVRSLEPDEAMDMVGVPEDIRKNWPRNGPWINKGYILLGADALNIRGLDDASVIIGELLHPDDEVSPFQALPKGQQAVYLHDGQFSLIQHGGKMTYHFDIVREEVVIEVVVREVDLDDPDGVWAVRKALKEEYPGCRIYT